ncbi:MAG: hypothetical protein D3923_12040 [Candidatus Electrothrix sp. AR3]|nr:hypothetical protein [Candidatus Electrothrix sp. AR3]
MQYDLEQWLNSFLQPDCLFGDWAVHTASWWALRKKLNVLVLTFSDLKKNTVDIIGQVAELMQVELSSEQLATVVTRSGFAWMKEHESQFKALTLPQLGGKKERPLMLRSGKSGTSGELLTVEQQEGINQFFLNRLEQLDSDFPYKEFFIK